MKIFSLLLALIFIIALNYQLSAWIMPGFFLYDIKRILEILLLLGIGGYLLASTSARHKWLSLFNQLSNPTRLLLLIILALGLMSALFAPVTKMAVLEVSLWILLFTFTLFIANQKTNILAAIIIGLVVYEITFFYGFITTENLHPSFVQPRFLNQYLIWVLPLISLPLSFTNKKFIKILIYIVAICAWLIALINFSKGMLLSLFIATVIGLFIFKKDIKPWLTAQIKIFAVAFLLALIGITLIYNNLHIIISINTRLSLWHQAWQLIKAHPLLGAGPMHYSYYVNNIAAHPHNSLLLIASEWGLPALLLCLLLYFRGLFAWLKNIKKNTTNIALTIAFIAGGLYSLVSGVLIMPLSQIMLCLIIGWMLKIYHNKKIKSYKLTTEIIFIIFLCFAMLGIIIGIVPTIFYLPQHEVTWLMQNRPHNLIFNPRFWLQGWINPHP